MMTKHPAISVFGSMVALYMLSYVILSLFGKYAQSEWNLFGRGGPQATGFHWAPIGFYDPATGEFRSAPICVYLPLWVADDWFWHTNMRHSELRGWPVYPVVFPTRSYREGQRTRRP